MVCCRWKEQGLTMKFGVVEIVISTIVLVLILFIVGYIIRKRFYKEVDKLESKKLDLMHRPVVEEMAKVKQLNMNGQTEKLFESWRQTWDEIIAVRLPNIDEMLFNAEEYTDRYRFKKAKETHQEIEKMINQIDNDITSILEELQELIGSEEKNRNEIADLLEKYKSSKKNLLSHRHIYGVSAQHLEVLLDSIGEKIANFENLTSGGNYLEAREVVLTLADEMDVLISKMEQIPDLLVEIQSVIPSQIQELKDGLNAMVAEGFILEHLQIDEQLEQINKELEAYKDFVSKAEVEEVETGLNEIKEQIDTLYDLLEKEVYAKHHVIEENEQAEIILNQLMEVSTAILDETKIVQSSYQLLDHELEIPRKFEKSLNQLKKRYEVLRAKIADEITAYSLLSEELTDIDTQLKKMQIEQNEFIERLQNLRKDELEVRDNLAVLQKQIKEILRKVKQSSMPGLPNDFEALYEQAEEQIADVYNSLNEKPLNMKSVQKFLDEAQDTVKHLYSRTEEHIETSWYAEKVIQYGNRYRGRNSQLRSELEKAERAFRNYDYKAALEQAATAVEQVEPGALKRIEELFNEELPKN